MAPGSELRGATRKTALMGVAEFAKTVSHVASSFQSNFTPVRPVGALPEREATRVGTLASLRRGAMRLPTLPVPPRRRTAPFDEAMIFAGSRISKSIRLFCKVYASELECDCSMTS